MPTRSGVEAVDRRVAIDERHLQQHVVRPHEVDFEADSALRVVEPVGTDQFEEEFEEASPPGDHGWAGSQPEMISALVGDNVAR